MKFISFAPQNWKELKAYIQDRNDTIGMVLKVIDTDDKDITILLGKLNNELKVVHYFPIAGSG